MDIVSLQNAQVKAWMKLHQAKGRKAAGLFLIEGEHLIAEALKAGRLKTLIVRQGTLSPFSFEPRYDLADPVMDKLSATVSKPDLIGICSFGEPEILRGERFLICDRIQDPGNLGTIIRTAVAFGYDAVLMSEDCVDWTNEKVIRSTQGALFHIPLITGDLLTSVRRLKSQGVKVYATGFENALDLETVEVQTPVAFILGNEGQGVSPELMAAADAIVKIEMAVFDSLNVAIAAGILAYRFRKRD